MTTGKLRWNKQYPINASASLYLILIKKNLIQFFYCIIYSIYFYNIYIYIYYVSKKDNKIKSNYIYLIIYIIDMWDKTTLELTPNKTS